MMLAVISGLILSSFAFQSADPAVRPPRHFTVLPSRRPPPVVQPPSGLAFVQINVGCTIGPRQRLIDCRIDRSIPDDDDRFGRSVLRSLRSVRVDPALTRENDTVAFDVWACDGDGPCQRRAWDAVSSA